MAHPQLSIPSMRREQDFRQSSARYAGKSARDAGWSVDHPVRDGISVSFMGVCQF
jgi:hypothetical protein